MARRQTGTDRIHALEIPTRALSLLLPSATIAEVVSTPEFSRVPLGEPWLLGAIGWRTLAVPVVSVEALLGGAAAAPAVSSKVVILYPLSGRAEHEFVGILTASEPRPRSIDGGEVVALEPGDLPDSPYLASGLRHRDTVLAIPDLEKLKSAFYPR
jgi:chemotaxis signal transduction protein